MSLKKLLNLHEEATLLRLRAACKAYGARVYTKVRVADVLSIEGSGISDSLFSYALKAHFDFVVTTSQHEPLFAVEYDGSSHSDESQSSLDKMKNTLCKTFKLPLLRVDSRYLPHKYREQSLLAWLIEVYFAKRSHEKFQDEGLLPLDEPFAPFNILGIPQRNDAFPFRLGLHAERMIHKLYELGKCASGFVPMLIGESADGHYRALACVPVTENAVAYVEVEMQGQMFPVRLDDLIDELALLKVQRVLVETIRGKRLPLPIAEFEQKAVQFRKQHRIWRGGWIHPVTGELTCPIRKGT